MTVLELNREVDKLLKNSLLSDVCVEGELSRVVRQQTSGHIYFNLKDENATVSCAMWSSRAARLGFVPKDGMKVVVNGYCSVYEKSGNFQIICERMIEDGIGRLYEELAKLKQKLQGEGYFDENHKKPLPFLPRAIGVCTSPTGAVIEDIRKTAERRFPGMPIILYPCPVQGSGVAPQIIDALKRAENEGKCDVIIVCRGGGSIEDLWCFNDEELAKAIYDCKVPVISAVGHGIDISVSDLVADRTAVTPTAAAELAVPEKALLESQLTDVKKSLVRLLDFAIQKQNFAISNIENRFFNVFSDKKEFEKNRIQNVKDRLQKLNFENQLTVAKSKFQALSRDFMRLAEENLSERQNALKIAREKLAVLGPESVLKRGYSALMDKDGKPITSEKEIKSGDLFNVRMKDGEFGAVRE